MLLISAGAPARPQEAGAYARSLAGGEPEPGLVAALEARYRAIGGASPLAGHLERQRAGLEARLSRRSLDVPVHLAMLHGSLDIATALDRIATAGGRDVVAAILTPQRAEATVAAACRALDVALDGIAGSGRELGCELLDDWHAEPRLVGALAAATYEALDALWAARSSARPNVDWALGSKLDNPVVFVAPEPCPGPEEGRYDELVTDTASLVAERVGVASWTVAYLPAPRAAEPSERRQARPRSRKTLAVALEELAGRGEADVVVAPVASIADDLEVLFGVDIEGQSAAARLGLTIERARSLNDDPVLIAALADVLGPRLSPDRTTET